MRNDFRAGTISTTLQLYTAQYTAQLAPISHVQLDITALHCSGIAFHNELYVRPDASNVTQGMYMVSPAQGRAGAPQLVQHVAVPEVHHGQSCCRLPCCRRLPGQLMSLLYSPAELSHPELASAAANVEQMSSARWSETD